MEHSEVKRVEQLLSLLQRSDASELEVETDKWRLRARRRLAVTPAPSLESAPLPEESSVETVSVLIRSPLVGFFQARADALKVGDYVHRGQVVCTIRAMGLMNEVRSPVDGRIEEVLVEDGIAVEYGQPLYRVAEGETDEKPS